MFSSLSIVKPAKCDKSNRNCNLKDHHGFAYAKNRQQFLCQNILLYVLQLVTKICAMSAVLQVSDFDTVVSENEHLKSKQAHCFDFNVPAVIP